MTDRSSVWALSGVWAAMRIGMALLGIGGAGCLQAGPNLWTRLGPESAAVSVLAIDPKNGATVYAAAATGLYKSDDEGATWSALKPGPPCCLSTLLIDPQNPDVLYAVTPANGAILKSTDGGRNWTDANAGLPSDGRGYNRITSLAMDPLNLGTLYAGNSFQFLLTGGVFKSTDGGETWGPANSGMPGDGVTALATDPQISGTLYASTLKGSIFKSTDGGANWSAVYSWRSLNRYDEPPVFSILAVHPQDSNTVYAVNPNSDCDSCQAPLYETADGGASWTVAVNGLGSAVIALAFGPRDPGTVFAAATRGLLQSTDAGAHWSEAYVRQTADTNGRLFVRALAIHPSHPDTIYAADTFTGILKSTDAGANWAAINTQLRVAGPPATFALKIDPLNSGALYAGTGAGVYKSTDAGANWAAVNAGLPTPSYEGGLTIPILAIDPVVSSTIYALDNQGLFKSTDGGANWAATIASNSSVKGTPAALFFNADVAIDPRNPNTLYSVGEAFLSAGASSGPAVIKSTDGGTSWNTVFLSPTLNAVTNVVVDP